MALQKYALTTSIIAEETICLAVRNMPHADEDGLWEISTGVLVNPGKLSDPIEVFSHDILLPALVAVWQSKEDYPDSVFAPFDAPGVSTAYERYAGFNIRAAMCYSVLDNAMMIRLDIRKDPVGDTWGL